MADILMPKATAVWLVDNTALTFDQIAALCNLHRLEVKGIADGEVGNSVRGVDPVSSGILSRDEIARCEADSEAGLRPLKSKIADVPQPKRKGSRYTPIARRADKPDAIAWFIRNHPEVTDPQIIKLIGTTKSTINGVRTRSHWNSDNIRPIDPVSLGLCTQIELDEAIAKSVARRRKLDEARGLDPQADQKILSPIPKPVQEDRSATELSIDDIFSGLK